MLGSLLAVGCSSSAPTPPKQSAQSPAEQVLCSGSASPAPPAVTQPAAKPQPKALEPFDPPPLAELDATADWQPQPVQDAWDLLRQREAVEKPLAGVNDLFKLKNNSPAANNKIVSALGRLPEHENAVDYSATINRHTASDVKSTNPLLLRSAIEAELAGLIGVELFGFDWNFRPFGNQEVISSWETSKDHLMDKVVLRDDLTWSDGKPITAHDVEFSFRTIMNPLITTITAVRSGTDQLRWVHAYDDRTVVMFHKEPLSTNVWDIQFPIIPKHVYEEVIQRDPDMRDNQLEHHPVCGGRYELKQWERGQYLLLTRRDSWYQHEGKPVRRKPCFEQIRIKVISDANTALLSLKQGDLDEMELTPEQWSTQTNGDDFYARNTKVSGPQWFYYYFGWNSDPVRAPFFTDKRVRTAMSYAFDHQEMLQTLLYGQYEPCNGIYHRTAWMAPKNPPPYFQQDLDKAEDLLDEAGWIDHDKDGTRDKVIDGRNVDFDFTILTTNVAPRVQICTLLKQDLERIGVRCNVATVDTTTWQAKVLSHDFQAQLGGWGAPTDPDASENVWGTGQPRNYVQYSHAEVDRLFEQGRH
jgi:peptide/nickel transport system substrate-binding protein